MLLRPNQQERAVKATQVPMQLHKLPLSNRISQPSIFKSNNMNSHKAKHKRRSRKPISERNNKSNSNSYWALRSSSSRWIICVTSYRIRRQVQSPTSDKEVITQTCHPMWTLPTSPLVNNLKNIIIKAPKRQEIKTCIITTDPEIKDKLWQMYRFSKRTEVSSCHKTMVGCICRISWLKVTSNRISSPEVRVSEQSCLVASYLTTDMTQKTLFRISHWVIGSRRCRRRVGRGLRVRCQVRQTPHKVKLSDSQAVITKTPLKLTRWRRIPGS